MKYDTVIWDWNGTLLDDLQLCLNSVNTLLVRHGKPALTMRRYRSIFRFPIEDYYKLAGFDFTQTPYSQLAPEYMDIYQPASLACGLAQGTLPVLKAVKQSGARQILASASMRGYLNQQLQAADAVEYFDAVYARDDITAPGKLEIARQIKQHYPHMRAVYIGDTPHDYEFAAALGADCILVTYGHNTKMQNKATGAFTVDNASQLFAALGLK